jgi:hypothetical protein
MSNKELLQRIETCHEWQSKAILELRELIKNENKFTQQAIQEIKNDILQKVQLNISEMEILAFELEG